MPCVVLSPLVPRRAGARGYPDRLQVTREKEKRERERERERRRATEIINIEPRVPKKIIPNVECGACMRMDTLGPSAAANPLPQPNKEANDHHVHYVSLF